MQVFVVCTIPFSPSYSRCHETGKTSQRLKALGRRALACQAFGAGILPTDLEMPKSQPQPIDSFLIACCGDIHPDTTSHQPTLIAVGKMVRIGSAISASLLLGALPFSSGLKFDLHAHTGHSNRYERCIRNFVARDTLVLVTAIVSGQKGDGQMVNMHVRTHQEHPQEKLRPLIISGH